MSQPNSDTELNAACFEMLLIEMLPMSYRIESRKYIDQEVSTLKYGDRPVKPETDDSDSLPIGPSEDLREVVKSRLEKQGHRLGQLLAERYTKDRPSFQDDLDRIKFICKDLWQVVFAKQVDNLKTNHRGVFVLTDNSFSPLRKASVYPGKEPAELMTMAQGVSCFFTLSSLFSRFLFPSVASHARYHEHTLNLIAFDLSFCTDDYFSISFSGFQLASFTVPFSSSA